MKFRKKPVVIEAVQYTSESRQTCIMFLEGTARTEFAGEDGVPVESAHLFIRTLEGEMRAEFGDWIIKGVKGEFYPCKPDIFAATYEPVDGAAP